MQSPSTSSDDKEETEPIVEKSEQIRALKIVMVGESTVGKSTLLARLCHQDIAENAEPTIGIEFGSRTVECKGETVETQIWDTAGLECYRAITSSYYKNADGLLLIYDITNRKSFEPLSKWLIEMRVHGPANIASILVANKIDLLGDLEARKNDANSILPKLVSTEEALNFAESEGMSGFAEISAVDNINVESTFQKLISEILNQKRDSFEIDAKSDNEEENIEEEIQ